MENKLRGVLISLCDDWEHNLRADFPDKRPNPTNQAINKITALLKVEVAKAKIEQLNSLKEEIRIDGAYLGPCHKQISIAVDAVHHVIDKQLAKVESNE